jgi:hypothetical protein
MLRAAMPGLHLVPGGSITAITGPPATEPEPRAALRHDRIVGRALESCSAVVPFRLGVELGSEAELQRLLEDNLEALCGQLARFAGRVEMGFKARLATHAGDQPIRLPFDLERVRSLAPRGEDRREQRKRAAGGQVFEGCYLISRQSIDAFWSAIENIRHATSDLPVMGSGPWAAYTFCDFTLRPAQQSPAERHPAPPAQCGEACNK